MLANFPLALFARQLRSSSSTLILSYLFRTTDTISSHSLRLLHLHPTLQQSACQFQPDEHFLYIIGTAIFHFPVHLQRLQRMMRNLRHSTMQYTCFPRKKNSVALVRERTIPTEQPPPVGEVTPTFGNRRGVTWSAQRFPTAVNLCFLDRSRYFLFK